MDFYVVMGKGGNRVARKKHKGGRIGAPHRTTKEQSIEWFKKKVIFLMLGLMLNDFYFSLMESFSINRSTAWLDIRSFFPFKK